MTTAAERVDILRRRILESSPTPPQDEWEWEFAGLPARRAQESGDPPERRTDLFLRVAGSGVEGHRMPVASAAKILEAVQGLITNIGSALVREDLFRKPQEGIRRATCFSVTPNAWAGSVVFHLDRPAAPTLMDTADSGNLAESSVNRFLAVVHEAQADSADAIGAVVEQVRPLGSRTASYLKVLVDELQAHDFDLALSHSLASGHRRRATLSERGCSVLLEAVERNRQNTELVTLLGILNTASDGTDNVRLTDENGTAIKLSVDAENGIRLGQWIGREVELRARKTTKWNLASGRETTVWELLEGSLHSK